MMLGNREIDMRKALGIGFAGLVLACGIATAAEMTKAEYRAGRKNIEAAYETERQKCAVRYGPAANICVAHAHGVRDVAKAELEAQYKPSARTDYNAAIARANASYANAKAECGEQQPAARKACLKEALDARDRARSEAQAARSANRAEEAAKRR
jgi:hypothetical protein